jgi:hypothetical protein
MPDRRPVIHVHRHPPRLTRRPEVSRAEVEELLQRRGWTKGRALSSSGHTGRFWSRPGQQDVLLVEDTATGRLRILRETRHDWTRVVTGKMPLS